MKIISWNVNGIRAVHRKGALEEIFSFQPDVLCLQETKARRDQLPAKISDPQDYFSFFNWPEEKKGYSGVAIYTKEKPISVKTKMGKKELDNEGRFLCLEFEDFFLLNVYFPNGGGGKHRVLYKLDFYDQFLKFIDKLQKKGKEVVFCGDVNTAHEEIDLARPKENKKNTGFLPEERAWIDEVVSSGYVDVFRHFNPNKTGAYTYWDMKTRARDRNVGWRIDYFFVSSGLVKKVNKISILSDVFGSDHCPIMMDLNK